MRRKLLFDLAKLLAGERPDKLGLVRLLRSWCDQSPPERGVNWYSSLELALRAITWCQVLRLVVLPQAMRIIIPPLTSNYLNLVKNSSLAVAIAYPDLVNVFAGTVLNQTGQAVEVILITMLVYLSISLLTSLFMNWFNARMALVER